MTPEESSSKRQRRVEIAGFARTTIFPDHRIKRLLRFIVEWGKRVLDVRCETGHLLASVRPSDGVGVEISDAIG